MNFSGVTLIIGAGAHKPYGFPTSGDLKKEFRKLYCLLAIEEFHENEKRVEWSDDAQLRRHLGYITNILAVDTVYEFVDKDVPVEKRRSKAQEILKDFLKIFCESSVSSIDAFLAAWTDNEKYIRLGKTLIAYYINWYETHRPLGTLGDDWIQYFLAKYIPNGDLSFFDHPPKIITFNYDGLFERYLYSHLTGYHRKTDDEAKNLIEKLNIIHVYGTFRDYLTRSNWPGVEFFRDDVKIEVVGERSHPETKDKIRNIVRGSMKIFLLGYGFDSLNNELLFGPRGDPWQKPNHIPVFCSNVGMGTADAQRIRSELGFPPQNLGYGGKMEPMTCLELLRLQGLRD